MICNLVSFYQGNQILALQSVKQELKRMDLFRLVAVLLCCQADISNLSDHNLGLPQFSSKLTNALLQSTSYFDFA